MKRRQFLKIGTAAAGATLLGSAATPASAAEKTPLATELPTEGYIREPARRIPVIASCDVLVAGAGPAGFAAALAAARQGADVILLERNGFLGGLWTGCAVLPLNCMGARTSETWGQVVYGIAGELDTTLRKMGMSVQNGRSPIVDPEATKHVMQQLTKAAGVRVLYYVQAVGISRSGDRIDSIITESKSGRGAIRAKVVVDTTGDGDIFWWAGEPFRHVRHHIGAMWRVGGLEGDVRGCSRTPVKGVGLMHSHGEDDQDGLDVFNLSRLNEALRDHIWERTQELRSRPGGENAFLLETPALCGVRVTRVLDSLCNVSMDDAMSGRTYDDVIGVSGVDIGTEWNGRKYAPAERPAWQIPLRALLPRKTGNLLVAGRCFGYTEDITYDAREIATCLVTGQAAGVAAARAVADRAAVQDLDVRRIQETLRTQNVRI